MGRVLSNVILPAVTLLCLAARAQEAGAQSRWTIEPDGAIAWKVQRGQAHEDHIEMSGRKVSVIVTYGAGERGELTCAATSFFRRCEPSRTTHMRVSPTPTVKMRRQDLHRWPPCAKRNGDAV